jgi:long-chain acyl-CoA synthetase
LKRFFLEDRYGNIIKALYSGEREVKLEAEVRYRDGRKGKVETIIPIVNVEGVV